jgi:hypothetical protein
MYSSHQPDEPEQQQYSEKYESSQEKREQSKSFWQRTTEDPIAFFTLWLAIFTMILSAVAVIQIKFLVRAEGIATKTAQAAKDSAEVAKQSLVTVQRAFVFIDSFQADMLNNDLIIMPRWRNSGTTPTRYMTNWANWQRFTSEPPDDFTFPDLDESGNPVDEKDKKPQLAFVGSNATTFAHALTIPNAVLVAMRTSQVRVLD